MDYLGDILGVFLIVQGIEQAVGPYKCDLVAMVQDAEESHGLVVVENQLEGTNHDHLGKLITYAAGMDAKIIVWIAKEFSEEHRQALDWLNENMPDINFFGLEIRAIQIDNSKPAISFLLVSSPNELIKIVQSNKRRSLSETELEHLQFWQDLKTYVNNRSTYDIEYTRKPYHQSWYDIRIGKTGVNILLSRNTRQNRVACMLAFYSDPEQTKLNALLSKKETIEEKIGAALDWDPVEDKNTTKIVQYKDFDLSDQEAWPEIFEWFYERSAKFLEVFAPFVRDLD